MGKSIADWVVQLSKWLRVNAGVMPGFRGARPSDVAATYDAAVALAAYGDRGLQRLELVVGQSVAAAELFGRLLIVAETEFGRDPRSDFVAVTDACDALEHAIPTSIAACRAHFDGSAECVVQGVILPGKACASIVSATTTAINLWDFIEVASPFPALTLCVSLVRIRMPSFSAEDPRFKPPKRPALYRYHPERFGAYHAFINDDWSDIRGDALATSDQARDLMAAVGGTINAIVGSMPLRQMPRHDHFAKQICDITSLALYILQFRAAGRQIFDMPAYLVDLFRKTDVDSVPMSSIVLPYSVVYLYFGPQHDIELASDWKVDGAYVSLNSAGILGIAITCEPPDQRHMELWPFSVEPTYIQQFLPEQVALSVGEAVEQVKERDRADLNARRMGGQPEGIPDLGAKWIGRDTAESLLGSFDRESNAYRQALRLVINSLFYITAYREDIQQGWPKEAPAILVENALEQGRVGEKAKTLLEKAGYRLVRLCGQFLLQEKTGRHISRSVSTEARWVRGHWRHQAYGGGRALRKLIWVRPYMVNEDSLGDEPPMGHLYLSV